VTSYSVIQCEYPSAAFRKELASKGYTGDVYKEKFDEELGDLFKIRFWRVILDEAHAIKNRSSESKF
jgi:SNF2 family DNA or RNA helicase